MVTILFHAQRQSNHQTLNYHKNNMVPSKEDTMGTTEVLTSERQNKPPFQGTAGTLKIKRYLLIESGPF